MSVVEKGPWSNKQQKAPPVRWNWETGTFSVSLSGLKGFEGFRKDIIEAEWAPPVLSIVRIREADTEDWSIGFITPLNGCRFEGLKPNTDYEIEVKTKNKHGTSPPTFIKFRTGEEGVAGISAEGK